MNTDWQKEQKKRFNKFKAEFIEEYTLPEDQVVGGALRVRTRLKPNQTVGDIFNWYEEEITQTRQEAIEDIYRKIPASLDLHKPMYADEVLERLKWIFPDIKALSLKKEE